MKSQFLFLSVFRSGSTIIEQFMNTQTDATVFFIRNVDEIDANEPVYTVDSDANLWNKDGLRIGSFRFFGDNNWSYRGTDGTFATNLGTDLIKAERLIVERLVALDVV